MNRNQYNLYVSNVSNKTNGDRLISYFSQFGKIESYTFFAKNSDRHCAAAIITYGISTDIDYIIKQNQRIEFDNRHLFLRRTLPIVRPAFERFMASNELLLSLTYLSDDEQFNEINIRKYFIKYGPIVSCRVVIPYTTFLIDYVDVNSLDCAILDEPHFYNDNELVLRKYISPNRVDSSRLKRLLSNQNNKTTKFSFQERVRRLKHMTEAIQFVQKVEFRLIKCSYEEKKIKVNKKQNDDMIQLNIELRNKSNDLNRDIEQLKQTNNSLKLLIEHNQRTQKHMVDLYKEKIQYEQNKANELKEAINLLNFH
ncbi:unnamed protein product [Adineta steineri]|uniref:RRM domain-containing protein n=1 Tax=Adineta steineri TaxID=433720 RepID=A0A814LM84_9BILA|nr:unnamed protein product [Adineta steineri]CAF1223818.1 unnamed protein product [Adineta steineri]CAF1401616.1 unnamed protein product [Adineta steineri]